MMKIRFTLLLLLLLPYLAFAQTTENVTFPSGTLSLQGTLSIPTPVDDETFPVVIMVHGSGPNDRDQTVPVVGSNAMCLYPDLLDDTIRIFNDIAEALVDSGFMVLQYDKRTFSHPDSLDVETITVNDFMADIHAAIDYVKTRPEVNDSCIVLMGYSQGAQLIPKVALERNDVSHLISLAGPITPVDTLLAQQFFYIINECNDDSLGAVNQYNDVVNVFSQVRDGSWDINTPILGSYAPFWKSWIDVSDSLVYYHNQANLPTLFIQGTEDINVPVENITEIENLVTTDASFYVSNGANHYLTNSTVPSVKQDILDEIIDWLKRYKTETSIRELSQDEYSFSIEDGAFVVAFHKPVEVTSVGVYTLQGQCITNQYKMSGNRMEVDIHAVENNATGLFILRVESKEGLLTKKIVLH